MKTPYRFFCRSLFLAVGLALSPAQAKIERIVEKSFTVTPGGTLRIETDGGAIRVQTSTDSVVKITARQKIRANSESEADELLKKLELNFEAQGSDVTATAKYERPTMGVRWGNRPVEVDFVVTVPARYSANLKTSGGDIVIGDLDGKVNARTSGGDVRLGKISGEIAANTSGGNVSLTEGGASVELGTSGGDITIGRVVGPTLAHTSGGNIKAAQVENTFEAKTSGGNVSAGFVGGLRGDCFLSTSGGQVRTTVEPTTGFRLDASTSGGDVEAAGFTITIEKGGVGKSRLVGAVNGGGPVLKLRSSGGDIVVSKR
ncbi:MAG: hypothetical protein H7343_09605 [Undibacterium sp.]|nr:hypothetical protein [Opitutaceae bacterium]